MVYDSSNSHKRHLIPLPSLGHPDRCNERQVLPEGSQAIEPCIEDENFSFTIRPPGG